MTGSKSDEITIHDVAAGILARCDELSTMKLQKLCFSVQGWHLATVGTPMFEEDFVMQHSGPVSPDLQKLHSGMFLVDEWLWGDAGKFDKRESVFLDVLVKKYSAISGVSLAEIVNGIDTWGEKRQVIDKYRIKKGFKRYLNIGQTQVVPVDYADQIERLESRLLDVEQKLDELLSSVRLDD